MNNAKKTRERHGMKGTRAYMCWENMKSRCANKKKHNYHRYGGRGISVCKEWSKFTGFYQDMGEPENWEVLDYSFDPATDTVGVSTVNPYELSKSKIDKLDQNCVYLDVYDLASYSLTISNSTHSLLSCGSSFLDSPTVLLNSLWNFFMVFSRLTETGAIDFFREKANNCLVSSTLSLIAEWASSINS